MTLSPITVEPREDRVPARGRFARTGLFSGLIGAICCVGNAIAVATGLGALSFFGSWMSSYQIYFVLGSLLVMAATVVWMLRRSGLHAAKRTLVRHAAVMLVAYVLTLGIATMVSGLVTN